MSKISLSTVEVRNIGTNLFPNWEKQKDEIKLKGRSLYRLIALKKTLEAHLTTVEETLMALAKQHNGVPQENGTIVIPPEHREAANAAFREFGEEMIEIEYQPIVLAEEDNLPVDIFDSLFTFIEYTE